MQNSLLDINSGRSRNCIRAAAPLRQRHCSRWLRCSTLLADRRDRHSWASSGLPVNRRLLWDRGAARWVICIDDLLIAFIWAARRAIDRERAIALRRGRGFHTIYSASHRRMASNNRESCFAPSCPATHVVSGAARSFRIGLCLTLVESA